MKISQITPIVIAQMSLCFKKVKKLAFEKCLEIVIKILKWC